jgi:hypothetical protein
MDSMDNFRERFEALEQWTEHLQPHTRLVARRRRWWRSIACGVGLLVGLLSLARTSQAADFACPAGDVACLIAAINTANANGEANTIRLEAGTYTLTVVDNDTDGPNGLPSMTSTLTLQGTGADTTSIAREGGFRTPPFFRLLHVAATGQLTLKRLTLRGGTSLGGGGINNAGGIVTVTHCTLVGNSAGIVGGGINNAGGTVTVTHCTLMSNGNSEAGGGVSTMGGMVTITHSTIADNRVFGPGGILNIKGTVTIADSTIADNRGDTITGVGGIDNRGFMTILNSTIARNLGAVPGILNGGQLLIVNSTIVDNVDTRLPGRPGLGIRTDGTGSTVLVNTILARNSQLDCLGRVTSLGTNLIEDPTGCTITLQPTDLTGDPGLDTFADNGRPGNGHYPLLPTSQAIDAGNDAVCPTRDQLGQRRIGRCDIGAIRFLDGIDRQHDDDPAGVAQAAQ